MPVNTTAQGNISISSINTENTSTTSNSLKTLSETAIEGLSTLNEAPYAMSEFSGYQHFNWGTPGITGSNQSKIFDMFQEKRNGNDTCVVCSFNIAHNASTKVFSINVVGTDDGGGFSPNFTGPLITLGYSGVITSLDARFVHTGENISVFGSGSGTDAGKVFELFSSTGSISNSDISNNNVTGSSVTASNNISSGASGTYQALRTGTGASAVALACMTDDASALNQSSDARITYTGSDSIVVQLRANGAATVNLFTRTGSFEMHASSSEEDTT